MNPSICQYRHGETCIFTFLNIVLPQIHKNAIFRLTKFQKVNLLHNNVNMLNTNELLKMSDYNFKKVNLCSQNCALLKFEYS